MSMTTLDIVGYENILLFNVSLRFVSVTFIQKTLTWQ